ncbi:hypothetical protein D9619_012017 [Psilocybe cf. subviscida]|uniref:Uncharacterized protein n=1 Tax=Psilocybe cf. subviscida TaxID=2480587 RepID=A0A8H5EZE7_9AGAR|nr:hypothetical protein D9619_012017 [Psilocybe cf. subviscida]
MALPTRKLSPPASSQRTATLRSSSQTVQPQPTTTQSDVHDYNTARTCLLANGLIHGDQIVEFAHFASILNQTAVTLPRTCKATASILHALAITARLLSEDRIVRMTMEAINEMDIADATPTIDYAELAQALARETDIATPRTTQESEDRIVEKVMEGLAERLAEARFDEGEVIERVAARVEERWAARAETGEARTVERIEQALAQATQQSSAGGGSAEGIAQAVLTAMAAPLAQSSADRDTADIAATTSYAAMLQSRGQSRIHPAHAEAVCHGDETALRFVVKRGANSTPDGLSEQALVTKANLAILDVMQKGMLGPTGAEVVAAQILRSGDVSFRLNTPAAAKWIRQAAVLSKFLAGYGGDYTGSPTLTHCIVEFVPLAFDPTSIAAVEQVEKLNQLEPKSIRHLKWLKKPEDRKEGQRSGFIQVGFMSRQAANTAILHGLYVVGKHCKVRRMRPEPRRCLCCQKLGTGHDAMQCPNKTPTCGRCAGMHRTHECKVADSERFQCSNCKIAGSNDTPHEGHGAAARDCPIYSRERARLIERTPGAKYRFFPTEEPWTWQIEGQEVEFDGQDSRHWERRRWEADAMQAGVGQGRLAGGMRGEGGGRGQATGGIGAGVGRGSTASWGRGSGRGRYTIPWQQPTAKMRDNGWTSRSQGPPSRPQSSLDMFFTPTSGPLTPAPPTNNDTLATPTPGARLAKPTTVIKAKGKRAESWADREEGEDEYEGDEDEDDGRAPTPYTPAGQSSQPGGQ